jgi:hypothetical protein
MKTELTFLRYVFYRIDIPHPVRAGCHAIPAANAAVRVNMDDTILPLIGSDDRADCRTDGAFTIVAEER